MNRCTYESAALMVLDQVACEMTVSKVRTYKFYEFYEYPGAWKCEDFGWCYATLSHQDWDEHCIDLNELKLFK